MRGILSAVCALCALSLAACDKTDIGQPCPELLGDTEPATPSTDLAQTETIEVVAYDPSFPCNELICVATAGRSGYCSKLCREDAACPEGFACREVQPIGSFAGKKYCVWKSCRSTSDCGDKEDFCCREVFGSDPTPGVKYCDFATNGHCE